MPKFKVELLEAVPFFCCNDSAGTMSKKNPWSLTTTTAASLGKYNLNFSQIAQAIKDEFPTTEQTLAQAKSLIESMAFTKLNDNVTNIPSPYNELLLEPDDATATIYRKIGGQHIGGPFIQMRERATPANRALLRANVGSDNSQIYVHVQFFFGLGQIT